MSTIHQAVLAASLTLPAMTTAGCGLFRMVPTPAKAVAGSEVLVLAELGIVEPGASRDDTGPGPSLIAGDGIAWAWGRAHGAVSDR